MGAQTLGMDARAIGLELKVLGDALERVKNRAAALEARAMALADAGESVPYHAIEYGQTRLTWVKDKVPEVAALVAMFGVNVQLGIALPTPAQCTKQGVEAAVITPYTTKPPGAKKLARLGEYSADKRLGRR